MLDVLRATKVPRGGGGEGEAPSSCFTQCQKIREKGKNQPCLEELVKFVIRNHSIKPRERFFSYGNCSPPANLAGGNASAEPGSLNRL